MVYAPAKYFTGLSPSEKKQRLRRIKEGHKTNSSDPRAYRPFKTDKGKKVKKSIHQLLCSLNISQWMKYQPDSIQLMKSLRQ